MKSARRMLFYPALLVLGIWVPGPFMAGCGGSGSGTLQPDQTAQQDLNADSTPLPDAALDGPGKDNSALDTLPNDWVDTGSLTDSLDVDPADLVTDQKPEMGPDSADLPTDVNDDLLDVPPADCTNSLDFDYTCTSGVPESCPGGLCVAGLCIGPVLDPDRWKDCGNGTCEPCEPGSCPVDCGGLPSISGTKDYDNQTTLTVWVHGFVNKGADDLAKMTYGEDRGCGGLLQTLSDFGIDTPCPPAGSLEPSQRCRVEYYGNNPAPWLSPDEIAEIEQYPAEEGPKRLHRYGLVVAKYIRYKLEATGATHVNIACHSMGCFITRYVIENNLENLAAENRIVRWFTSSGVLAGARLARLYDNQQVQQFAEMIGLAQSDFVIMNPDFVQDNVCWWDHQLWQGNNPLLAGTIIHHACATDPHIAEALNITLLDLNNPGDEPNDGIMYTFDEFFHSQTPQASFTTPQGQASPSTHSFRYLDHMTLPESDAAAVLAGATLFHHRKVYVKLTTLHLKKDRESHMIFDGENGSGPAEVVVESEVRYNPFIQQVSGRDILVHEDRMAHRGAEMFTQGEGQTQMMALAVYEAPVFDQMQSFQLSVKLLEADWYPRYEVTEWAFDTDELLGEWSGDVALNDHTFSINNEYITALFEVKVVSLY